jgi:hypothetical protein
MIIADSVSYYLLHDIVQMCIHNHSYNNYSVLRYWPELGLDVVFLIHSERHYVLWLIPEHCLNLGLDAASLIHCAGPIN